MTEVRDLGVLLHLEVCYRCKLSLRATPLGSSLVVLLVERIEYWYNRKGYKGQKGSKYGIYSFSFIYCVFCLVYVSFIYIF